MSISSMTGNPDSLDTFFDVLSDRCRRYALYCLLNQAGPMQLEELALTLTERDGIDATRGDLERLCTEFHHVHCPKMKELGIIEFDERSEMIMLAQNLEKYEEYISLAAECEDHGPM